MQLLTPLALAGALLALPILLLYMLRLRRQELEVPSIMLWQQLLQDTEANTPWQRLRRNLLLLLQLLILAALVLALARPFITVPAAGSGQIVLLLDASASMNASDVEAGTRFRAAQDEARAAVAALGANDRVTLIRVAEQPQLLLAASNDPLALQAAIDSARPGMGSADWPAAPPLALGGMAQADDYSLVIISDGGLGDPALLPELPDKVTWLPVGRASDNLAITALATRRRAGQPAQLFTRVTNYGARDSEVVLSLKVDGELVASAYHEVQAGADLPLVVDALPASFRQIEASLTIPLASQIPDHLELDNRAWALVEGGSGSRVLLFSPGNRFIEEVLRSLPGVDAFRGDLSAGLPREAYDLTILDRWQPEQLPAGDLLFINPRRDNALFTVGEEQEFALDIRVTPGDARTRFVDLDDVSVQRWTPVDAPWAQTLVEADGSPLLLAGEVDGRQVAIFTFDVHRSDLALQIAWPVLMANLLDWFAPPGLLSARASMAVGDALQLRPPPDAEGLRVRLPDGTLQDLSLARRPLLFAETQQPGIYTIEVLVGGAVTRSQSFAVNLFDPAESDILPREMLFFGQSALAPGAREEQGQL
ncbi:MAG: VWA domain-containing protein, partial [Anaerolineaceae bacterium]|nr:VWA domain-containing protein [Anaerolineaceae bacterium]